MNHKRILVAVSLRDDRDAAFERALALAKASDAELYLLHAVPANRPFSFRAAQRTQRLVQLRERAAAAGVSAQAVQQHGDPAGIIVLHADTRPIDLIVIGTARRTGWARWRQRSVAERVLRRTDRPTLVVGRDDAGERTAFKNVLVAVDLSPGSGSLIDAALRLSGGHARQLTVVHAVDTIESARVIRNRGRWTAPEYHRHVLDDARRRLDEAIPSWVGPDVALNRRVAAGPAAHTIGAQAADVDADLIVLGRTPRILDLGSTAVRLVRNTDRALLIVPATASAQAIAAEHPAHKRAA